VGQFHWDPDSYLELVRSEVPDYEVLQNEVAAATDGIAAERMLELGTGTGVTARNVLARHPGAHLTGIDASAEMLGHVDVPGADLHVQDLSDPLPEGPFDVVFSALAVHHLDGPGKAALFHRVAAALAPGGRFVLGDVIVPEDPGDVVTPIDDRHYDQPDSVADQLAWLRDAGFDARVSWLHRDLAVLVGDRQG
jgi:tRNA (cmo5U34)-methyltransferase